jgi:hypothetical protein
MYLNNLRIDCLPGVTGFGALLLTTGARIKYDSIKINKQKQTNKKKWPMNKPTNK